jgi:hypothetical protein
VDVTLALATNLLLCSLMAATGALLAAMTLFMTRPVASRWPNFEPQDPQALARNRMDRRLMRARNGPDDPVSLRRPGSGPVI